MCVYELDKMGMVVLVPQAGLIFETGHLIKTNVRMFLFSSLLPASALQEYKCC